MEDITYNLCQYISSVSFEDINPNAIAVAKKSTLDTLGAMLAGSNAAGVNTVVDLAKQWRGTEEAHVIGWGDKLPAPLAALCNGTMARAMEIDDCLDFLPVHPSASIVPALLALAEMKGDMSGRDFLTSLAIGQDVIVRMGMTLRQNFLQSGHNNMFDIFGPTAALTTAMKFDPQEVQNALGISFSFAIGDGQSILDGALTVRLQQGLVAQGALLSVLLTSRGFTGAKDFLFGKHGYLVAFEPEPRINHLIKDLGKTFYGEMISYKPFSSCRGTHGAIELALRFRNEIPIDPKSIQRITVWVSPEIDKLLGTPREMKIKPETASVAQFSIQFTVAAALIRGDFFLKELEQESIQKNEILDLAQRIYIEPDPSMRTDFAVGKTMMQIEFEGSPTIKHEIDLPLGSPSRPMRYETCVEKFLKCAPYSIRPLENNRIKELAEMVSRLEDVPNVSTLISYLY